MGSEGMQAAFGCETTTMLLQARRLRLLRRFATPDA